MGKWHRAGGPRAPACGRRVERVPAPPWLDHRFELITLVQVESGAPSPALGHLLVRETVSATARETGTAGQWHRSRESRDLGGSAPDPGTPRDAPGRIPGSPAVWRPRAGPTPPDRGTPRDRPRPIAGSPAIWAPRAGPTLPDRGTPRDSRRPIAGGPAIWADRLRIAGLLETPRGGSRGAPQSGCPGPGQRLQIAGLFGTGRSRSQGVRRSAGLPHGGRGGLPHERVAKCGRRCAPLNLH